MKKPFVYALAVLSATTVISRAAVSSHSSDWLSTVIPLPQEMAISDTVRLLPGQVRFEIPPDASAMVTQAVDGLRAAYQEKSGSSPTGTAFTIHIGRLSAEGRVNGQAVDGVERLRQARHSDQAYLIRPVGTQSLIVAAWHDKGVFYGVQTLIQLLTAQTTRGQTVVPMAFITDWPDMDERGTWDVPHACLDFILPWMAALKLNFTLRGGYYGGIVLKKDEPAKFRPLPVDVIRQASMLGFHVVPVLTHYDYWTLCGLTNAYPELVGKGDSAKNPMAKVYPRGCGHPRDFEECRCPCASNPKFTELVTDCVRSAADQGVREISLWLSEFAPIQCACHACMTDGPRQFQLETQASIDALQAVHKQYPDLVGRIFFTLGGLWGDDIVAKNTRDGAACLAMLPAGIKAEKVYIGNPAFDDYAAKGHWLATYSGPTIIDPHQLVRFAVATPMRDSVDQYAHYSGLYCICNAKFDKRFADYQLHALAEWTWNRRGRDRHAFAVAWATRQGMPEPSRFGDWIDIMEPVEMQFAELYGGIDIWDKALSALADRRPLPTNFPAKEKLTHCLAECEQALALAFATGDPSVMAETEMVRHYFQSLCGFVDLHREIVPAGTDKSINRATAEHAIHSIQDSLESSARHLEKQQAILWTDAQARPADVLVAYRKHMTIVVDRLKALPLK